MRSSARSRARGNHPTTTARRPSRGPGVRPGRLIDVPGWLLTGRGPARPAGCNACRPTSAVFSARHCPWRTRTPLVAPTPAGGVRLFARPGGRALGVPLPTDMSGHQRSVPDTRVLPFTSANVRCQRAPAGWFFPDTEVVPVRRSVAERLVGKLLAARSGSMRGSQVAAGSGDWPGSPVAWLSRGCGSGRTAASSPSPTARASMVPTPHGQ
jgi:hypothetical protein